MSHLFDRLFFSKYIENKEKIVDVIHKHPCPIFWNLVKKVGLYWVIPLGLAFLFQNPIITKALLVFILFGTIRINYQIFKWYSSVFILSDKHLIFVDWQSIIKQNVVRIHYEDIETIEVHTSTFVQNIFNFGHLEIKTANNTNNKTLHFAAQINKAQSRIANMQDQKIQDRNQGESDSLKKVLTQTFQEFVLSKH